MSSPRASRTRSTTLFSNVRARPAMTTGFATSTRSMVISGIAPGGVCGDGCAGVDVVGASVEVAGASGTGSCTGDVHATATSNVHTIRNLLSSRAMIRFFFILAILFTTLAAAADDAGAALYRQKMCHTCHGPDGSGNTPTGKALEARDLRSEDVQKQSDAELAEVIANGKGKMPAYNSSLDAEQIKELVAYIRRLK